MEIGAERTTVRAVFAILLDTFPFRLMAMLHIAFAIATFGPMLIYPTIRKTGDTAAMASIHMRIVFPALILLWVFGMGLAGMSEDAYKMDQLWLMLSLINWAALMAVSWFLIRPATTDQSESATKKLAAGTGITHLGMVFGLILMIWKPGL